MKGLSIGTIIGLVIGVIILIVLTPLLFKAASNVWDQLAETLGIVKYSPIERAMICYYYLCKGGCGDPNFHDFCSPDKIGRDNYEEVCSLPEALGIKDKICTDAAFQFPLKVTLDSDEDLSKDRLKKKIDTTHILIMTESSASGISWYDVIKKIIIGGFAPVYMLYDAIKGITETYTFLTIHDSYLTDVNREEYKVSTTTYTNLVKYSKVRKGTYYVSGNVGGWPNTKYFIFTDDFVRYLNFTNGKSYSDIIVSSGQIIRISIEDEKTSTGDLKDYNYLMSVYVGADSYGNINNIEIKFWNISNANNPDIKSCSDIHSCGQFRQFLFNTKNGIIHGKIERIDYDIFCSTDYCKVWNERVVLNLTYFNSAYFRP